MSALQFDLILAAICAVCGICLALYARLQSRPKDLDNRPQWHGRVSHE